MSVDLGIVTSLTGENYDERRHEFISIAVKFLTINFMRFQKERHLEQIQCVERY